MTILSKYLEDRDGGSQTFAQLNLKRIANELEEVLRSADLSDEEKYDLVFKTHKEVVAPLLKEARLRLEYYHPDTTYIQDAWAYVSALKELVDPN